MLIIYDGYRKGFLRKEAWAYSSSTKQMSTYKYSNIMPIENSRQMLKYIKRKVKKECTHLEN